MEPCLRRASINIAEGSTLARLLHLPAPPEPSPEYATQLVERMPRRHEGSGQTSFVRYGYAMMEETVDRGRSRVYYHTGYAQQVDGSGYGYRYRVAAPELKWWLTTHRPATPDAQDRRSHHSNDTPTTRDSQAHTC